MATWLAVLLVVLTSCAPVRPLPGPFVSPVATAPAGQTGPQIHRYYLPVGAGEISKRGVGTPYSSCDRVELLGGSWHYNWTVQPPECERSRAIAMVWGRFDALPVVPGHAGIIAGFNEPDLPQQANLTPEAAARLWRRIEDGYPRRRLIAPAPSPWGREWLVQFRNSYIAIYHEPPRFDAGLAAHCYATSAEACIEQLRWYLARAHEWGAPGVWLSEFAFLPCMRTTAGVAGVAPMSAALAQTDRLLDWLEAEPGILGYAWFCDWFAGDEWWAFQPQPQCDTALVRDGQLTPFGQLYVAH